MYGNWRLPTSAVARALLVNEEGHVIGMKLVRDLDTMILSISGAAS